MTILEKLSLHEDILKVDHHENVVFLNSNSKSSIPCSYRVSMDVLIFLFGVLMYIGCSDLFLWILKLIDETDYEPEEEILLKTIPPGIDETDCDLEEEIRLIEKLFDSLMEEIDLSFTPDDSMPPRIKEDDYDSKKDMLIFEELLSNDSLLTLENKLFHFDIPSFSRPPAKPPDDDLGILTVKMVGDTSKQYVPMPRLLPTQPTLVSNQEKSHHLLSHQGFKASQLHSECPMMIYGGNTPILDVQFLHFYPP
nr:hypothetical protein [Tanacetum cinerariifolium]